MRAAPEYVREASRDSLCAGAQTIRKGVGDDSVSGRVERDSKPPSTGRKRLVNNIVYIVGAVVVIGGFQVHGGSRVL
jgi:hypothetical protein